jgi:hypothetical protein
VCLKSNRSPAREYGIGRHINATEARKLCPNIHLAHVQTWVEGDTEPRYHENPTVKTHKVDPYMSIIDNRSPSIHIVGQVSKSLKFSDPIVIMSKKPP